MEAKFARMMQRLHSVGNRRVADAIGTFQAPGCHPVDGLALQVDRNLEYEGADGRFQTDAVGISWYRADLEGASSGDIFIIGTERLVVEKLIADDGHMLTAACQVQ
ncbi:hypothetical protein LF844_09870 [Metapseudomonas lalkuanensis]|uniref:hypothetical protein n=1 Tax=Metapseudomonas lalkuanensis TaxID=2604832 RepID=UPI001CF4D8DD|nr:hypothetical protein [Pseudomonas lalkuanensis]UCP00096.1 hypothetical protein LF844_09870 [Pseudomonas lalkuanensis]